MQSPQNAAAQLPVLAVFRLTDMQERGFLLPGPQSRGRVFRARSGLGALSVHRRENGDPRRGAPSRASWGRCLACEHPGGRGGRCRLSLGAMGVPTDVADEELREGTGLRPAARQGQPEATSRMIPLRSFVTANLCAQSPVCSQGLGPRRSPPSRRARHRPGPCGPGGWERGAGCVCGAGPRGRFESGSLGSPPGLVQGWPALTASLHTS